MSSEQESFPGSASRPVSNQGVEDNELPTANRAANGESLPSLFWHARWTVPMHVLLPILLWWLLQTSPAAAAYMFWGIHLVFLVLLLISCRWWWNRADDLLGLLLLNHFVTFVVVAVLPW